MPGDQIDPKYATRLAPKELVVVSWYSRRGGMQYRAGRVVATKADRRIKIKVWAPVSHKPSVLQLRLKDRQLYLGRLQVLINAPNIQETATIEQFIRDDGRRVSGWRYDAKQRYQLLSGWKYWAQKRLQSLEATEI